MPISGSEPSSVILSQTKYFKIWKKNDAQKVSKQAQAKRDGVMNPWYPRPWLHVPSGTPWSTSIDTSSSSWKMKRDFYLIEYIILNRI